MSERPVVAHCVREYLRFGSNWIYPQIGGLRRFRPVVLCKRTLNLPHFPLDAAGGEIVRAYSNPWQHAWQKFAKRWLTQHYPVYFKAIERIQPPILHSHFGSHAYEDLVLKRRFGMPHVVSVYGADIWKLGETDEWRSNYQTLFAESDVFLAEGRAMKQKMVDLGCDPAKIRVHHIGVNLEKIEFVPRRRADNGIVRCLMAGRAVEKKGMIYGLRAFANVARKYKNLHLTIMTWGDSRSKQSLTAELKRAAEELRVADRVTWYGLQPYDVYLRITRESHIFLAPSVLAQNGDAEGGCPVTVIELSAAGMPILGSHHCDIPDVVLDGKSGLLAAEKDVAGLTDRLEHLVTRPELWEPMGRAGRAHIEAEYNARVQVAQQEDIYDTLL